MVSSDGIQSIVTGRMTRIVYAQFSAGTDLYNGIVEVIKRERMHTGVILNITGTMTRTRLSGPTSTTKVTESPGYFEIEGLSEATGSGYFGHTVDTWKSEPSQVEHLAGDPFLHVHLVVNVKGETHCGHLIEGCTVRSLHDKSHFLVVLGEVEGVDLSLRREAESGLDTYPVGLPYYELAPAEV